jgi:hypothetical protein
MKRIAIALLILLLIGGAAVIGWFSLSMGQAFEFAQNQARTGRTYMDSMKEKDFDEAMKLASELMAEPEPEWSWNTLSPYDKRHVPSEWQKRGVIFIRYDTNWVSFGWHGGPHAHTNLDVTKESDGSLKFTAHSTENPQSPTSRRIRRRQADKLNSGFRGAAGWPKT